MSESEDPLKKQLCEEIKMTEDIRSLLEIVYDYFNEDTPVPVQLTPSFVKETVRRREYALG